MDSDSNARDAKNYHVRITRGWADISGVIASMAEFGPIVAAYEHHPDTGCKSLHCHVLFYQSTFAVNTVKGWIVKALGHKVKKEHWYFKTTYKTKLTGDKEIPITAENYEGLITYMSKGKLEPKYVKGIDSSHVRYLRDSWVEYKKQLPALQPVETSSPPKTSKYITLVDLQGICLNDYMVLIKDYTITDDQFMNSKEIQHQLTLSVGNTGKRIHAQGLLQSRLSKKLIVELSEFCMLHLYPTAFSRACAFYWRF